MDIFFEKVKNGFKEMFGELREAFKESKCFLENYYGVEINNVDDFILYGDKYTEETKCT